MRIRITIELSVDERYINDRADVGQVERAEVTRALAEELAGRAADGLRWHDAVIPMVVTRSEVIGGARTSR